MKSQQSIATTEGRCHVVLHQLNHGQANKIWSFFFTRMVRHCCPLFSKSTYKLNPQTSIDLRRFLSVGQEADLICCSKEGAGVKGEGFTSCGKWPWDCWKWSHICRLSTSDGVRCAVIQGRAQSKDAGWKATRCTPGEVFSDMSCWEDATGQNQDMMVTLYLSARLKMPQHLCSYTVTLLWQKCWFRK